MMLCFKVTLHYFMRETRGATAIEYGLIAAGIALAIFTAVFLAGDSLSAIFDAMAGKMTDTSAKVVTDIK